MRLIGTYVSPYARRVAAALVSRNVHYEHEDLNGYADPARARELNPVGKVPVLVLDDGEHLIDSSAILDHLNELFAAHRPLVPSGGFPRRAALRLASIAMTVCEQVTAHHFERRRPAGCALTEPLERYRLQVIGGFKALDAACVPNGPIGTDSLDISTISSVVAFEYASRWYPDLVAASHAPALAAVTAALANDPAFALTRPAMT
jgi:glutathione S-transferase